MNKRQLAFSNEKKAGQQTELEYSVSYLASQRLLYMHLFKSKEKKRWNEKAIRIISITRISHLSLYGDSQQNIQISIAQKLRYQKRGLGEKDKN